MNLWIGVGRIQRIEQRVTQNNNEVTNFTVVTDASYVDKDGNNVEKVHYHSCAAWGRTATKAAKLKEGDLVSVYGERSDRPREYGDQTAWVNSITVSKVTKLSGGASGAQEAPQPAPMPNDDDGLPF